MITSHIHFRFLHCNVIVSLPAGFVAEEDVPTNLLSRLVLMSFDDCIKG